MTRLADELRAEFPEMRGFSRANLDTRRQFAAAWPDEAATVQQAVGRLLWGHIGVLLSGIYIAGWADGDSGAIRAASAVLRAVHALADALIGQPAAATI